MDERLENLSVNLETCKEEPFYETMKEEFDKLALFHKEILKSHEMRDYSAGYVKVYLDSSKEKCLELEEEMSALIPDWSIPHPPILDEDSKKDELKFQNWLFEYYHFLSGLKEAHPVTLKKFTHRVYSLKHDLEFGADYLRQEWKTERLWKDCIALRGLIQAYESKFSNLTGRLKIEAQAEN